MTNATATPAAFDPALVTITRKRFSVTQGEVLIEYAGQRIEQYGDAIALRDGEWRGYSDDFLMNVAKREAIERGLASEPTPDPIDTARAMVSAFVDQLAAIDALPDDGSVLFNERSKLAIKLRGGDAATPLIVGLVHARIFAPHECRDGAATPGLDRLYTDGNAAPFRLTSLREAKSIAAADVAVAIGSIAGLVELPAESYPGEAEELRREYRRLTRDRIRERLNWGRRNAPESLEVAIAGQVLAELLAH